MQARAGGKKICKGCGKQFVPKAEDNNLCPDCLADRAKVLDGILAAILGDALEGKEPSAGASPVEGYDKVALLGKGGMGEVWKVRERSTGKILALKTMLPQVAADEKGKEDVPQGGVSLRTAEPQKCSEDLSDGLRKRRVLYFDGSVPGRERAGPYGEEPGKAVPEHGHLYNPAGSDRPGIRA